MIKVSYAQHYEDVRLDRVFASLPAAHYIDVGAAHPLNDSVTAAFYQRGWSGLDIEPSRYFCDLLRSHRERDVVVEAALSNVEGTMTLHEAPDNDGSSTLEASAAAACTTSRGIAFASRDVEVTTLTSVAGLLEDATPAFLKIDVEGHERQVLLGADWQALRPVVLVIEATQPNTRDEAHEQWEALLVTAGYRFAVFDGLNRFYVREEEGADMTTTLAAPLSPLELIDVETHRVHVQLSGLRDELARVTEVVGATQARLDDVDHALANAEGALAHLADLERLLSATLTAFAPEAVAFPQIRVLLEQLHRSARTLHRVSSV